MGRPPMPAGKAKSAVFLMRLSPTERSIIDKAAHAKGVDASTWARKVVLQAARRAITVKRKSEAP